jgi:hypothetical protein
MNASSHRRVSMTDLMPVTQPAVGEEEAAMVVWDTVMAPEELITHRRLRGEGGGWEGGARAGLRGLSLFSATRRARLCFITSLKLDGQRQIYLQQLERLPRERYCPPTYVSLPPYV